MIKSLRIFVAISLIVGQCFGVQAALVPGPKVEEKWECTALNGADIVVEAYIFEDRESGRIYAAGTHYTTSYDVDGFNRKWEFGINYASDQKPYVFFIGVTGVGRYYDLTKGGISNPWPELSCKSVEVPAELKEVGFDNIDANSLIENMRRQMRSR